MSKECYWKQKSGDDWYWCEKCGGHVSKDHFFENSHNEKVEVGK
jgi:hypothetical protein